MQLYIKIKQVCQSTTYNLINFPVINYDQVKSPLFCHILIINGRLVREYEATVQDTVPVDHVPDAVLVVPAASASVDLLLIYRWICQVMCQLLIQGST